MIPVRLVALDVDGTLLRSDGAVAPADRLAIARARSAGTIVTLATGRLPSSALPVAAELGLTTPLVCCDGAVTVCPRTHGTEHAVPLSLALLDQALRACDRHRLMPFLFTPGGVVANRSSTRASFLKGWSSRLIVQSNLDDYARAGDGAPVLAVLGVASMGLVQTAHAALQADRRVGAQISSFQLQGTDHWAVRVAPDGVDKASGLSRLANQLGIPAAEVAVVGDWYNDVAMFAWAGHSFCMGHAPQDVLQAARHRLVATADDGGGVAEAFLRLEAIGTTSGESPRADGAEP